MKKIFVILQDSENPNTIGVAKIKEHLVRMGLLEDCIHLNLLPPDIGGSTISSLVMRYFDQVNAGEKNLMVVLSSSHLYSSDFSDCLEASSLAYKLKRVFPIKYAVSSVHKEEQAEQPIDYWFDKTISNKRSEEIAKNIFQIYTESSNS